MTTWQKIVRGTWGGRDAHGGVPFDKKDAWRQGYDEAMRQVRRACQEANTAAGTRCVDRRWALGDDRSGDYATR